MEKSAKSHTILIATPLLPTQSGGPAQYAAGLTKAFIAKGHVVAVLAFQEVATYPSGIRHIILFGLACRRMRGANMVIVLDTLSMALPVVIAAYFLRKKIIVRTGGDFVWEHYVERTKENVRLIDLYTAARVFSCKERVALWLQKNIIIPLTDVFVFSTPWQWNIWTLPYALHRTHACVIENACVPYMRESHATSRSHTVVWIGRDIFLKNVHTLDRAMRHVQNEYPHTVFKKHSGIAHDEVLEVLRTSRMLVIPSISEVSPNLALEAIALGVPVVLTRECGMTDRLADAVTWIDPLNEDDIATKIGVLMTHDGYAHAILKTEQFKYARTYDDVAAEFLEVACPGSLGKI